MRVLIVAVAALSASASMAGEKLSIVGTYGSAMACALYAVGGEYAVLKEGMLRDGTMAEVPPIERDGPLVLLTPTTLVGIEMECSVSAIADGNEVGFSCDSDAGEGVVTATITEDRGAGTVAFDTVDGTQILRRCR